MVTVSILSIVILIFVLHTIITHLINWMWRSMTDVEDIGLFIIPVAATILETFIMVILLKNFIQ